MKNLLLFTVFVTLTLISIAQTVTDIDGNVYQTVTIGTQVWMAENLKTTKYNDGTTITLVTDPPGYYWYDNDSATYARIYGALYNWYSIYPGNYNICPKGWHLPEDAEWRKLEMYLGMSEAEVSNHGWRGTDEGGKLKESGTAHWFAPNTGATNETGFTALPGGYRDAGGSFGGLGYCGYWWSSTGTPASTVYYRGMTYDNSGVERPNGNKENWFSVRCLKDENASITKSVNIDEVTIYPNPTTEKLYFKNYDYLNGVILIVDLQGKQVLSKQMDSNPIDISNLKKGIYFVKLVVSENVMITKLIKE